MTIKPTLGVFLDKRKSNKTNQPSQKYPIKLRLTFNRKMRFYGIDCYATEKEWSLIEVNKARGNLAETQLRVNASLAKAKEVIDSIDCELYQEYPWEKFKNAFYGKSIKSSKGALDVATAFEEYILKLKEQERVGTAASYLCAKNSILEFNLEIKKRNKLLFEHIDSSFLENYEVWMKKKGCSDTTTGIYLRSLRALFNLAIERGQIAQEFYPFGKNRYVIPTGRNIKKALTLKDVQRIIGYECRLEGTWQEKSRDYWVFSYLCNGINMKDMLLIRYKHINEDQIVFRREKTKRTSKGNDKPIVAYLPDLAKDIIEKWGQKKINEDTLVFPELEGITDPDDSVKVRKNVLHVVNKWMKRIGDELEIKAPITTYTARHTFSTVLKRSGASIEFISESLGHSDIKTTESYLDSFEDDTRKEMSKRLLEFD